MVSIYYFVHPLMEVLRNYLKILSFDFLSLSLKEILESDDAVKITCLNCGNEIVVTEWDDHQSMCQNGSSSMSSTSTNNNESIIIIDKAVAEPDTTVSGHVTVRELFGSNIDSNHTASTSTRVSASSIECNDKIDNPDDTNVNNSSNNCSIYAALINAYIAHLVLLYMYTCTAL